MTEILESRNSTYEVDWDGRRIRRIKGANPPSPRQGEDGVWQEADVQFLVFGGLLITWADGRQTVTSAVRNAGRLTITPQHDSIVDTPHTDRSKSE